MHFNINVNEKEYCLYCLNSIHDHVFWKLVDILKENSWKFNAKQLYSEATEKKNTHFTKPFTIIQDLQYATPNEYENTQRK